MSTNFPTALDTLTNPTPTDYLNSPSHAGQHANANDAIEAIEAKVGINSSAVTTSHTYKITAIETILGTSGTSLMSALNPIGTIREFNVATNPATLLGFGTWSAYGTGRVTVAIDAGQTEFDTVDETGGAKTHTLTSSESGLPAHSHPGMVATGGTEVWVGTAAGFRASGPFNNSTAANASSAHNNLQPYIVVYRWVRTA